MSCPECHRDSPAGARFCMHCAAPLVVRCGGCDAELPASARFCPQCAAPAPGAIRAGPDGAPSVRPSKRLAEKIRQAKSNLEGERKQVTVLFADVKGSMELAEQLDPEAWSQIMHRFFQILSEGVERFEGFVDKFTGDGIMALFGAPVAHEDHAQRACYAALHLRDELRRFAQELRREQGLDFATRFGLNSGEVIVGRIGDDLRMDYTAQGHTVGLALRMEALAEAGKIYLTAATARRIEGYFALEDLGAFNVKGASAPVHAYALEGLGHLRTRFDRSRDRGLSRFVGRDDEMRVLEAALARADQGEGQVVTVVAPAGTGKSRLCFELVEGCRAKGITVIEAQALAHGRSIPLRPVLEMFRQRFGIGEHDPALAAREKIAGVLLLLEPAFAEILPALFEFMGVADPARPAPKIDPESAQRRMLQYFRRIVQADTRERTIVVLIEDLHWLDDASDRFVAALVESAPATRAFVLLNFRPEYGAEWLERPGVSRIVLPPLGPEAVRGMLVGLIGDDPSVQGLAELIHSHTAGNPFFAEEIVQALIEDGSLAGTVGAHRLTRPIGKVPLPETVQTVLAARIDRLEPHAKHVLQTAAVVGREPSRALLAALCEVTDAELQEALATLHRAEFLFETALYPHVEYAFKHPLTHEVAYQSQLAARRAAVHRAAAHALETLHGQQLDERAAEIAWHWEAAEERATAAHWHIRAANWVEQRDAREALRHWRTAYELLPVVPEDRTETARLVDVCQHLLLGGWSLGQTEQESRALLERGTRAADHHGDVGLRVRLRVAYANSLITRGRIAEYLVLARENAQLAARSRDEALRALTLFEVATAEGFAGNLDECERALDEFFRSTPSSVVFDEAMLRSVAPLWRADMLQYRGRSEAGAADIARAREMAASADPITQMLVGCHVLVLAEARGECPDAMDVAVRMMKAAEEFGAANLRALARAALARAHALRSEWGEATRLFEEASAIGNQHGVYLEIEGRDLASLAHAYVELGRAERAREVAQRAVALAQERGSRIQELENVVALARAEVAVGHDDAVDPLLARAETLIGAMGAMKFRPHLAEIRAERARRRGDHATWRAELDTARRLFTETGATGHAERVAGLLATAPR